MTNRFVKWFDTHGLVAGGNAAGTVWNFYEPARGRGNWIYPMLSGKAVIWRLERGELELARQHADALLPWQQTDQSSPAMARSYGAFPSKLEPDGNGGTGQSWKAGTAYYSGDNLVIIEALTRLYEETKEPRYLNAAIGAGTWIVSAMCQGHKYGVWKSDLGAPMHMVNIKGDFANQIYGQMEWLWIGALKRLGRVTGEAAYSRQADRAREFYLKSQLSSGAYLDHYDPGYPPQPYSSDGWKEYAPGQLISDNVLRSALGACRSGALDSARRLRAWLHPDQGAVPAYLSRKTGGSGFERNDLVYYDIVSCGLLRSLSQWLSDRATAAAAIEYLRQSQSANGGWHWGIKRRGREQLTGEQAPIVGMWATADLSRNAGEV